MDPSNTIEIDLEKLEDFQSDLRSKEFCRFVILIHRVCNKFQLYSTFVEPNVLIESDNYH
jgi:hypothetical protein